MAVDTPPRRAWIPLFIYFALAVIVFFGSVLYSQTLPSVVDFPEQIGSFPGTVVLAFTQPNVPAILSAAISPQGACQQGSQLAVSIEVPPRSSLPDVLSFALVLGGGANLTPERKLGLDGQKATRGLFQPPLIAALTSSTYVAYVGTIGTANAFKPVISGCMEMSVESRQGSWVSERLPEFGVSNSAAKFVASDNSMLCLSMPNVLLLPKCSTYYPPGALSLTIGLDAPLHRPDYDVVYSEPSAAYAASPFPGESTLTWTADDQLVYPITIAQDLMAVAKRQQQLVFGGIVLGVLLSTWIGILTIVFAPSFTFWQMLRFR